MQVLDVLEADAEAHRRAAGREARRGASGCAVEGNREAFVASPGIAESEQLEAVQERRDAGLRHGLQHNRKEAGGAGEVALPKRVARMVGQGGVDDAKHFGPVAEPVRKRQPLAFRLPQAKLHRAQAAKREKHVLCAGRDRHQVDRAVKPLEPLLVPRHETEQQVRVTRKILGARLDREIDAMGVG